MRAHHVLVAAIVAAAVPAAVAQRATPQPSFHSEIDYVEFPVRVLDAHQNLVRDLSRDDFRISEDGVPQTLETFELVEDTHGSSEPEVVVTDAKLLSQAPGQIYLFLLDDYHLLPSELSIVKQLVSQFIRTHVTGNDRAAVVYGSGGGGQDFTNSREALLSEVDRFRVRPGGSTRGARGADAAERLLQAKILLQTLSDTTTWLAGASGRHKAILLLSDGAGCAVGPDCGLWLSDAIRDAQRADVSIYPVRVAGMSPSSGRRSPIDALSTLATETGGFMTSDRNNLTAAFDRIVHENSFYYLIGYYSTNDNHNGKLRKHQVNVNRPGLHVLHRPGYLAPTAP